jgi:molybdenum cofactor cytidylyltransferase
VIAAVVLAAGRSERMGRSKADLPLPAGGSFLDAIRGTLARLRIDAVFVVVAPGDPHAGSDGTVVNPDPSRGMLSSVQCGLRALPTEAEAVLLWPVDHPRVEIGTVATLLAAYRAHPGPGLILPVHGSRRGHPVLFAGAALAELSTLSWDHNAAEVVHAHADRIEIEVDDPAIHDDIDDAAAYERVFGRPL